MSNILQHQHENMAIAYDMMMNLKDMFGKQNRARRQVAMRALLNTKMAEGTPVRDHILEMIVKGVAQRIRCVWKQTDP